MSFLAAIVKPLAYISLPLILARQIAVSNSPGRYYARVVVYVSTLMTVASCSIVAAAGMSIVGRASDVNHLVARVFYHLISRALDLEVVVEGEENLQSQPAVLMANHQSMLDIFVVGKLMPKRTSMTSKRSLQFTPLGPFMAMSGAIFIDRGNNARAVRSLEAAGEKMKATRTSLWMFPEGTRHMSREPTMLPLKKGGFHLAINAGFPILPIVTENYWHLYRKGVFKSGIIKVRVLPAIPTTGLTPADVGSLSTRVRDVMLEALREISPKVPSESSSKAAASNPQEEKVREPAEPVADLLLPTSPVPNTLTKKSSSSSIASSAASSVVRNTNSSENGTETEEDEGMVLVGRPQ
ncbi:unnamed protein product [Cyclocybe aegerita]|uniref:1-acyl-sn-glycerol-3-phosphate acyltransferase n=1 Tax=Cyclocybe aegerita TaxID=1973307 RepID=A0A8S0VWZ2_CYCAE|nr:unnamed protein product [Cyclocybe aegerita]